MGSVSVKVSPPLSATECPLPSCCDILSVWIMGRYDCLGGSHCARIPLRKKTQGQSQGERCAVKEEACDRDGEVAQ